MRPDKIAMSIVLIAILMPMIVQAQTGPKIRSLAILGKGIAASPDDPMDFMIAKFGIGEFSAGNHTFRTGVLILDDVKYKLRDINISDSRAIGNIYLNNSKIGSFDVSSVMKGDTEIWAGTLS
ncbi:MAG: hypothetical protein J7L45_01985, partial [Candidatus Aenigmarchaeota archaeon]|nr:hypothetical protein [Candidatus Aenigmarchaeota archaeon]